MLNVHKFGGYTISILKNSNKILSSTQESFAGVKPGTLIKIDNSDILYPIISAKNIYYSKDFQTVEGRKIKIGEHTSINIQKEDLIKIIYDEFELSYVVDYVNKGNYYIVGDELTVKGGELSINISDGMGEPIKFKVEEIEEGGTIKKLSLINKGKYIKPPENKVELCGGAGEKCVLELKYKTIDSRNVEEKIVKYIEFKNNETFITLDYSLPLNLKAGRMSLEKSELTLGVDYLGDNKIGVDYKIIKDFTEHLHLPLTVKNNPEMYLLHNQAMQIIDRLGAEVKELRKMIDKIISS